MKRKRTGNPEADQILGGGIPYNSVNVIMGLPGSGKTIFVEQLAFANLSEERPILYLSTLSEPLTKLITYLQELSFADVSRIGSDIIYEDLAGRLRSIDDLPGMLQQLIQDLRPHIIIIDSFKAIADLAPDRPSWRRVLFEVAGLFAAYDTTVFWVGEYEREDASAYPEFAVADGIIHLWREQTGTSDDRFIRVVKMRGSGFSGGNHAFLIDGDGLHVYPRLVSPPTLPTYEPSNERVSTGIPQLDEMMGSGLQRGTATLVAGPSGSGKSIVGWHFLRAGVDSNDHGLLVSFQENPTQVARAMAQLGWEPHRLLGPSKLDILYRSPVELQIDTLLVELFRRIDEHGVHRVMVDGVGDLHGASRDTKRFRDYMYAFIQQLTVRSIPSLFTVETAGLLHLAYEGIGEVSFMADSLVQLEMRFEDQLRRKVRVLKTRGSDHDKQARAFRITNRGVVVE